MSPQTSVWRPLAWLALLICHPAADIMLRPVSASKNVATQQSVDIGHFVFPMSDDTLPSAEERQQNATLLQNLYDLWDDAYDFYYSYYYPLPGQEEANNLTIFAQEELVGPAGNETEYQRYAAYIMQQANDSLQNYKTATPPADIDEFEDLVYYYIETLATLTTQIQYWNFASYMGVGWSTDCSSDINLVLSNATAWQQAGSQAATTLMALIPTLLAFGNLYVPSSSEAFATSTLIGLTSAIYSLGLPVKSLPAVKSSNRLTLASFPMRSNNTIEAFGQQEISERRRKQLGLDKDLMKELQSWTDDEAVHQDESKNQMAGLRTRVMDWHSRWHWWYIPSVVIAALQATMFALAIAPLLVGLGIPRFLFSCSTNFTGLYLGVSACVNAVFRFLMWEMGYHERVKIYALSETAKKSLRELICEKNLDRFNVSSVVEELPPLYPPLLARWMNFYHKTLEFVWPARILGPLEPYQAPKNSATMQSLKVTFASTWLSVRGRVKYLLRNPLKVLMSGFSLNQRKTSAMRWRPMILLCHLSTSGRNVLLTLFSGFIEALLYVVLTFFFAAQWGGNLVITGYAILLLLVFITAGRAVSLVYVMWSSRVWGLHFVNCDSEDQILGTLRILCSMKGVLVVVNGATYFEGYWLDQIANRNNVKGILKFEEGAGNVDLDFPGWKLKYEKGEFDDDNDITPAATAVDKFEKFRNRSSAGHHSGQPSAQPSSSFNDTDSDTFELQALPSHYPKPKATKETTFEVQPTPSPRTPMGGNKRDGTYYEDDSDEIHPPVASYTMPVEDTRMRTRVPVRRQTFDETYASHPSRRPLLSSRLASDGWSPRQEPPSGSIRSDPRSPTRSPDPHI